MSGVSGTYPMRRKPSAPTRGRKLRGHIRGSHELHHNQGLKLPEIL
jgi:hypothetical protein